MEKIIKLTTIVMVISLLNACSSTRLTSSWLKEGYVAQKYNKILVFAIAANTNNRAIVETAMVNEFNKSGINAVSSVYLFPLSQNITTGEQLKAIPKEELAQKLKDNNIDGFLILSLLDKKQEQVYVEGQTYTQPSIYAYHPGYYNRYYPVYNNYYNYYSTAYTTVTTPGYYINQTSFSLESNFYNVSDESLVWSGQSKAVDPSGISQGAADWSVEVVRGMKDSKVFLK